MLSFFKKRLGGKKANKPSRADRKLLQEVERLFLEDKYLKKHNIHVAVMDGIVTLQGMVTSPLLKNLAEEVASGVIGVQEIRNEIELGIGKAGEDLVKQDLSPSDVQLTEASNTGDPNLHHPSTTTFSEVQAQTREDVIGGIDTGIIADEAAQMAIPQTGSGSSVMDAGAVDAIKASGEAQGEDFLMQVLTQGMAVVDRDGKTVGKVKEVRTTDFLLKRGLARDIYVPYFVSKYDGTQVIIDVLADEIKDQGWAMP